MSFGNEQLLNRIAEPFPKEDFKYFRCGQETEKYTYEVKGFAEQKGFTHSFLSPILSKSFGFGGLFLLFFLFFLLRC
jgi:hypothetical protein